MSFFESAKIKQLPKSLLIIALVAILAASCSSGEKELQKLKARAEKGDIPAQYSVALMYFKGKDIPQNYEEAMKWFQIAAYKEHGEAQYFLGLVGVDNSD